MAKLRITLVKSPIGKQPKQRITAKTLGLTKLYKTVEHEDTPQIRGMINKISHMVKVEEV